MYWRRKRTCSSLDIQSRARNNVIIRLRYSSASVRVVSSVRLWREIMTSTTTSVHVCVSRFTRESIFARGRSSRDELEHFARIKVYIDWKTGNLAKMMRPWVTISWINDPNDPNDLPTRVINSNVRIFISHEKELATATFVCDLREEDTHTHTHEEQTTRLNQIRAGYE